MLTSIFHDLTFGLRLLLRQPGRSLLLVLTLALGIGANAALFTVVNAVVLRPLPYPDPDRLVRIWDRHERNGLQFFSASLPHYVAWRDRTRSFAAVGAYREEGFTLSRADGPVPVEGVRMTASLFDVLKIEPEIGRRFSASDDRPNGPLLAVVSHEFWRRELNRNSSAIGQSIVLNRQSYMVVGVMPATFRFPQHDVVDVLVPYGLPESTSSDAHFLRVLGRLQPKRSLPVALDELNAVARQYNAELPENARGWTVTALSLHEAVVGPIGDTLLRLQAACLLVLLIATINVANLLIVRAAGRAREIAIRAALGAGTVRIVRQLLTESLLLAGLGSVAGLALGNVLFELAPSWLPASIPRMADLSMEPAVVIFVLAISLMTGVLFGIAPAIGPVLRAKGLVTVGASRSATASHGFMLRRVLVAVQLGLALTLLATAALLVQSSVRLASADRGFRSQGVLTFDVRPSPETYRTRDQRARLYRQIVEGISVLPGVVSAGVTHRLPLTGNSSSGFRIVGRPADAPALQMNFRSVSGGYFTALGIARLRGRAFTDQDVWERIGVVIINHAAARQFGPNEDPIGQRILLGEPQRSLLGETPVAIEVVGIVADTFDSSLRGAAEPLMYLPYVTAPVPATSIMVRTTVDPASIAPAAARAVARVDAYLPIARVRTLDRFMDDVLAQPRFNSMLASLFAVLALVLAAVGVYGVIAGLVMQRTREFGIRLALGAQPAQVVRHILGEGVRLTLAGILLGVGAALALGRLLADLLYGVTPNDAVTLAAAAFALFAIALVATIVPARRVLRVDPVRTLREE
jgi:putative ABC transport system permease protein